MLQHFLALTLTAAAVARDPAPELGPNQGWINTDRPLSIAEDLRGHCVVLFFWTRSRVSSLSVAEEVRHYQSRFPDEPLVFIGIHSAKPGDGGEEAIRHAARRLGLTNPIVLDSNQAIWSEYGIMTWPTYCLIETGGRAIGLAQGEAVREIFDFHIPFTLERGRNNGSIAEKKADIRPDRPAQAPGPLNYPGKVLAVLPEDGGGGLHERGWLFIADSSNHRVVAATYPDADNQSEVVAVFGAGEGFADGPADAALFRRPQGMAFDREAGVLYVADAANHAVRSIDLRTRTISTVIGDGRRGSDLHGGNRGTAQSLAYPWDLAISRHDDGALIYIAMAGTNQVWSAHLGKLVATPIAGDGREDLRDGAAGAASLAQPSGLALSPDARRLYIADCQSSSVRVLDFQSGDVSTIIGADVFEAGDIDGPRKVARLNHCLGLAVVGTAPGEALLVADTQNSTIKVVEPAGTARRFFEDDGPSLGEPGGVSLAGSTLFIADTNNHRIIAVDVESRSWREVALRGLEAPKAGGRP